MLVWFCIGMIVFIISSSFLTNPDMSICKYDNSNWNGFDYNSPDEQREHCLKDYDNITKMFGYGAWVIGAVLGIIRVITSDPNENNSNCQKCGKGYGLGFIWIPKMEWNVKETKVCKKCYKEMESNN
jgi:hypothetical protein